MRQKAKSCNNFAQKWKISFHTIDFISAASNNFCIAPVSRFRACIPALVYTACISAQTIQSCQLALQIFHNHQFFSKVGRYQRLKFLPATALTRPGAGALAWKTTLRTNRRRAKKSLPAFLERKAVTKSVTKTLTNCHKKHPSGRDLNKITLQRHW